MYVSIVASVQKDLPVLSPAHQVILGAAIIKTAPYALPNSKKITFDTEKAIEGSNAALMANHGCVCIGSNLEDVFTVCKTLEDACSLYIDSFKKKAA
jgi:L-fuculose-phosphate aldolase